MEKFFIKDNKGNNVNINEVKDLELLKEEIREFKRGHINTLDINLPTNNELDKVKLFISMVYEAKMFKAEKETTKKVSDKYKNTLAIYTIYGFNKSSKKMVADVLGLKNDAQLNSINNELRNMGLMYKDEMNNRISHLCDELKYLSSFIKMCKNSSKIAIRIIS